MNLPSYILSALFFVALTQSSKAQKPVGDNLGNHKASQQLDLKTYKLLGASTVAIGKGDILNPSIALEIAGTNKAILVPRVSSLAAIANPTNGMIVYSKAPSEDKFFLYQNGSWTTFASGELQKGYIWIGNAMSVPTALQMTGEVVLDENGVATIVDNVITTIKLADNAVTSEKIAANGVETTNIANAAVSTLKIANLAVTTTKLQDNAVTTAKLQDNSVTREKINTSTTGPNKLLVTDGTGTVIWIDKAQLLVPPMANGQILVGQTNGIPLPMYMSGDVLLSPLGVTTVQPNKVTSAKIKDGTINTIDIKDDAITADRLNATVGNNKYLATDLSNNLNWIDISIEDYQVGDIKAIFPHLVGGTPTGWVECNGQTLIDATSTLNNKVIPNLNNDSYLAGTTSNVTGSILGASNRTLIASNLPQAGFTNTTKASSETSAGTPSGSVTLANGGSHSHSVVDPGHTHPN
ncbi:MAG: hypothetical protein EOO88_45000, partial [Pedobacter sp.]